MDAAPTSVVELAAFGCYMSCLGRCHRNQVNCYVRRHVNAMEIAKIQLWKLIPIHKVKQIPQMIETFFFRESG